MKGYIYSIRSHQIKDIYIGSTIQSLSMRMASHRRDYKNWKNNLRTYCTSFKIIQCEDAYIELLQEIEVQSKQELHKLEGSYIRETKCVNRQIAGRTDKEYYKDNKEKIDRQHKKYFQEHYNVVLKEKITCECGSIICKAYFLPHQKSKKHIELMKLIN